MESDDKNPKLAIVAAVPNPEPIRNTRDDRIALLRARIRAEFPNGDFGRRVTKEEEDEILGYGPDGF